MKQFLVTIESEPTHTAPTASEVHDAIEDHCISLDGEHDITVKPISGGVTSITHIPTING